MSTAEASRRSRQICLLLLASGVLLIAALLNSLQSDWSRQRLIALADPSSEYVVQLVGPVGDNQRNERYQALYAAAARSYVEKAFTIHVPIFGFAIDVNYLGIIGGLALIALLTLPRFSLSRERNNLELTFAKARAAANDGRAETIDELLAMEQVTNGARNEEHEARLAAAICA